MDRRQRKTRDSIIKAFVALLQKRDYSSITVSDVIERADVGRATFYSHFETKDYLLRELCKELFDHIFDKEHKCGGIFDCDSTDSMFLHLVKHLEKNDNNVLELLAKDSCGLFMEYFSDNLKEVLKEKIDLVPVKNGLPIDYWTNHVASTFISTIKWWVSNGKKQSSEAITKCFLSAIN